MYPYVYRAMLEHMLSDPVNEVCGLIIGHESTQGELVAVAYKPISNVHRDTLAGFTMDPSVMLNVLEKSVQTLDGNNFRVIGCYHTHPHWSYNPSATDLSYAQTFENDFPWLIYGAMDGTIKYWHYKDGKFHPGTIQMVNTIDMVSSNNRALKRLELL